VEELPFLFLVPARGGSRRVSRKNLRTVAGIPLVGRAVRLARSVARSLPGGPHAVVCSTDDAEIAAVAAAWGAEVPFLRPAELATDGAASVDVALHALEALDAAGRRFGGLALLQPTSPLTAPEDLAAAIAAFRQAGAPVVAVTESHPGAWHQGRIAESGMLESIGGPDATLLLTGAFYVIAPATLRAERRFLVEGSTLGATVPAHRSVDVDEDLDLQLAEALAARRPIRTLQVGKHAVGAGPAFLIAEAGVNHNGDPDLAHRLIDAAAAAGADAVKFQTFDPGALAAAEAPLADYQRASEHDGGQREMLARLALPAGTWQALAEHAAASGITFLSSPFDEASAELLDGLGVPAFKVPSGELTNHPFLAHLARKGRPLLISTGMADILEVAAALDAVAVAGDPPVALFHCVSSYPAAPEDANLRAMATLRAAFGVPVGWSDHTPGIEMSLAAVALGAELIEKHLTLDRSLPGPDHRSSLEPEAFGELVRAARAIESGIGSGEKRPTHAEIAMRAVARKSLHWTRDLAAGTAVGSGDLAALRPGTGIAPSRLGELVGRPLVRPVAGGSQAAPDDVEGTRGA
jgi:N,N'-diacetyllegionaminate synthase